MYCDLILCHVLWHVIHSVKQFTDLVVWHNWITLYTGVFCNHIWHFTWSSVSTHKLSNQIHRNFKDKKHFIAEGQKLRSSCEFKERTLGQVKDSRKQQTRLSVKMVLILVTTFSAADEDRIQTQVTWQSGCRGDLAWPASRPSGVQEPH